MIRWMKDKSTSRSSRLPTLHPTHGGFLKLSLRVLRQVLAVTATYLPRHSSGHHLVPTPISLLCSTWQKYVPLDDLRASNIVAITKALKKRGVSTGPLESRCVRTGRAWVSPDSMQMTWSGWSTHIHTSRSVSSQGDRSDPGYKYKVYRSTMTSFTSYTKLRSLSIDLPWPYSCLQPN